MARVHLARRAAAVAAVAVLVGSALPALAGHRAPFDGATHAYGEMVEYPLAFPVGGSEYWYEDWFWAPRTDGDHHAQDIMAPKGTPVLAAAAGTVTWVNWSQDPAALNPDRCCTLVVTHRDGWETWYIHLDNDTPGTDDGLGWGIAPGIAVGVEVEAGQLIGWLGDSGNAEETPPHLHFELHDPEGVVVNPYDALRRAEGHTTCSVSEFPDVAVLMETTSLLQRGARGTAVTQLQQVLAVLGFDPGIVDGVFGPRTEAAVRAFQGDRRLASDGIVGSRTRAALAQVRHAARHVHSLDPDGRIFRAGSRGDDVEGFQHLLVMAGHDPGAIDGDYGPLTASAVRSLQSHAGIAVDGLVGPGTRTELAAVLGLQGLIHCG